RRPETVAAGERFSYEIPLKGVAYAFQPGSRIRLALSTTYWPMVWPEPQLGGITIFPEATVFSLPGMPGTAVQALPDFGPAISAHPIPSEDVAPGSVTRTACWEATTGRADLASRSVRKT